MLAFIRSTWQGDCPAHSRDLPKGSPRNSCEVGEACCCEQGTRCALILQIGRPRRGKVMYLRLGSLEVGEPEFELQFRWSGLLILCSFLLALVGCGIYAPPE